MARKDKRADYRRPHESARPARPAAGPAVPAVPRRPRGAWLPIAAALVVTLLLIVLIVALNQGSAPLPTVP